DGDRPMEPVTFTTEDGIRLEGELRMPDGATRGAAVLCHPHPRHGGSKDHPLLWAIRNDLAAARGLAVLGFNFRGVMGSSGTYGGGRDELRDTRAAIEAARSRCGLQDPPTIVVGWSFGASVALREALDDARVNVPASRLVCPLVRGSILGSRRGRRIQTNGSTMNAPPNSPGHTKKPRATETAHTATQSHGFPHHGRSGKDVSLPRDPVIAACI